MTAPSKSIFQSALVAAALLFFAAARTASAQAAPTTPEHPPGAARLTRGWISLGIGAGGIRDAGIASLRASGTVAVDRTVFMVRGSINFEGSDGHVDLNEVSLLGGRRFGGKYLSAIATAGIANAHWHDDYCTGHAVCTPAQAAPYDSKGPGLAFDLGLHADALIAGLGLNLFGILAPPRRKLVVVALSLEAGWFGK